MSNNLNSFKKKYIFLGDLESINVELIAKSFNHLKNKIKYIIIGDLKSTKKILKQLNFDIEINCIFNPFDFEKINNNKLNIFDLYNPKLNKVENILNQLKFTNNLCNTTGYDLVTMPIDKSLIKRKIEFIGMTEYLGQINKCRTFMLMYGENFSIIPITTHINLRKASINLNQKLKEFFYGFNLNKFHLNEYKNFIFLCFNPHCGENGLLGDEDYTISKSLFKNLKRCKLIPGDSAFKNYNKNTLYFSLYHDQALIPFKILNKKTANITIGLKYRRLSPAHGVAKDIRLKNLADNLSYLQCMLI